MYIGKGGNTRLKAAGVGLFLLDEMGKGGNSVEGNRGFDPPCLKTSFHLFPLPIYLKFMQLCATIKGRKYKNNLFTHTTMSKTSLIKGKKLLKQAVLVMALVVAGLTLFHFIPVFAQEEISTTAPEYVQKITGGQTSLRGLILTIVNTILTFLGVVAVIMIIYGGMLYVTAAGKQESIDKGKKILMYTVIGIVIIMLSFVIVNAVLGSATETATQ